jgi:hypothetical protein
LQPRLGTRPPRVMLSVRCLLSVTKKSLCIASVLLTVACYSGDGEFERHGIWPISAYSVSLPPFVLQTGLQKQFSVRGWRSHASTIANFRLSAEQRTDFASLDLKVEIVVTDRSGRTLMALEPEVFGHLERMQRDGEASRPENEWLCQWEWPDHRIDRQAVPFTPGVQPLPTTGLLCWHLFQSATPAYEVNIRCVRCSSESPIMASLELSSGWK